MTSLSSVPAAILLVLLQALAAIPWLCALSLDDVRAFCRNPVRPLLVVLGLAVVESAAAFFPDTQVAGVPLRIGLNPFRAVFGRTLRHSRRI